MELIWDDAFKKVKINKFQLNVIPELTSIFMTEPILNPYKNKIKMAESVFETFKFDRLQIGV